MKTIALLSLVFVLAGCKRQEEQPAPEIKNPRAAAGEKASASPDLASQYEEYRDKALEFIMSGDSWSNITDRDILVTPFQLRSFQKSGEVKLIAQAPSCHIDKSGHRSWDSGHLVLFTPTTNVWMQGDGFLFYETNHVLYLSNNVETRIARALLKTTTAETGTTNAGGGERILKIFAKGGEFNYESNYAVYQGGVHLVDPQLDLTTKKLTIHFTTNGAVENALAEGEVVMTTTNNGQTTSDTALYFVTNGVETVDLKGNASWRNGDETAQAGRFIYDKTDHFLTAIADVTVCWPNAAQGAEERPTGAPPRVGPKGFREMWADYAELQMPPTNGPVETMHAVGNVKLKNQADGSLATGQQADYARTNDLFVLSGNPVWGTEQMEIQGRVLTADLTNNVYHARGGSHVKLKAGGATHSNEWLYIDCANFDYRTNHAEFHDDVKTRLLDEGVLKDTLDSDFLVADLYSNEVKTAVATGNVRGRTAPDKRGNIKTVTCDRLTMNRSPTTGMTKDVVAENHVVLKEFGANAHAPSNTLTATNVTAWFSTVVTNQIERAVATGSVVFDQVKTNDTIQATGQRGVYTASNNEVVMTGEPVAHSLKYLITGASELFFNTKTSRFSASGVFHMSKPMPDHPVAKHD